MMLSTMMLTVAAVVVHALSTASNYINVVQRDHEWPHQTDSFAPGADDDGVQVFRGNLTAPDHFHHLYVERTSLLVGASNVVYNISLETLTEINRLTWFSSDDDVQQCLQRQKTHDECQNYIRVIARRLDGLYLVCATNAYRPLCRTYTTDEAGGYSVLEVESGVARCPYDPSHNSTSLYVGGRLYSATVADFSSRDPLIYSSPLRTEQHDSQWLNDPNFVSSFHLDGMVYFFFRETAVENINCGKAVFSRVARVCTSDNGGVRVLRNTWTSFFKARLNCSVPGDFPFYFDEIQSTSELGEGNVFPMLLYNDRVSMVYAVFTTPRNSLRGSAVCAFKMDDIVASFEGPHKEQKTAHSNWLPAREVDIPDPHPAKVCANNSQLLSDQTLSFIKSHPLMDKAIPAFGGQPLLTLPSLQYSLTQIAVDWGVFAADGFYYDVLFIGTDHGHVLKVLNTGRMKGQVEPVIIEDIPVFPSGLPVITLQIHSRYHGDRNSARLVVMSRGELRSVPLHRCRHRTTCSECVALRDPYCSWVKDHCVHSTLGYQSVETGRHAQCDTDATSKTSPQRKGVAGADHSRGKSVGRACSPCICKNMPQTTWRHLPKASAVISDTDSPSDGYLEVDASEDVSLPGHIPLIDPCYDESLDGSDGGLYTAGTVAAIVILCMIIALLVGFVAGLCLGSRHKLHCLYARVDHFWSGVATLSKRPDVGRQSPKHAVQNTYDLGPGRRRMSPAAGRYDAVPTTAPRPPKDCNRQKCAVILEPKLNNLYVAGHTEIVDVTPQPPPRRHRPSKR